MQSIIRRSSRRVRHWAYDPAKYFGIDPHSILHEWSTGQVAEAIWAMETYSALEDAQTPRDNPLQNSKLGGSKLGSWM